MALNVGVTDTRVLWAPITDPTAIQGELPATTIVYSDVLNAPGNCIVTFPLDPYPTIPAPILNSDTFAEARTALWVVRGGVPMWAGIVWGWSADLTADTVTAHAEGWLSYLRRRRINQTTTYTGVDQAQIANALVDLASSPIVVDPAANHGVTRDRTYHWWQGQEIGLAVEQLAAVRNGFDFRFAPRISTSGQLEVLFETEWPPRGRNTDIVFELGVNCTLSATADGSQFATQVRAFGSGEGSDGEYYDTQSPPGPWLPLETTVTYPDVIQLNTLIAHAARDLQRASTPIRLLDITTWSGTEPTIGSYRVGDIVDVTARRGFFDLRRARHRITTRTITVTPDNGEQVTLTAAPAAMFAI